MTEHRDDQDAPKKKKRRRRADGIATRKRVLGVATALFASGGYEATSLRQIAAASEIDIATLKYHFGDKAALFAQVYQAGHEQFLHALAPIVAQLEACHARAEVRQLVVDLVRAMQDFVSDHLDFVRLVLFRLMEDSDAIIDVEDDLQNTILAALEARFDSLIERGVIEPLDTRAFVAFLISSFAIWQVTARVKANWVGEPRIDTPRGKRRSQAHLISLVQRMLGVEEPALQESSSNSKK